MTTTRRKGLLSRKSMPAGKDRLGWHNYYAARWCRTQDPQAVHLAMWYLMLHLSTTEQMGIMPEQQP